MHYFSVTIVGEVIIDQFAAIGGTCDQLLYATTYESMICGDFEIWALEVELLCN